MFDEVLQDGNTLSQTESSVWIYVILGIIACIVLIVIIIGIRKLIRYFTRPEMQGMSREQIIARWAEIRKTSEQGVMGAKLAIMEADTLLDAGLKSMMMPGETLGERLKVACYKYPRLRDVWPAHKLRNSLAHEATFQISHRQAKQAIDEFEKALKILNVM
ncbi:hypothetical protein IT408_02985 [Candidatus Uhrbacteria bacterium]|nr:hypothetical protein [Candidatus Uhrbacteria bacterium]